ncbi:hypothetical protein HUE56_05940 (plasmid) [Azospirillum oryzae]|uniref:Uncharacterized protein n=1 Tax=Azospirillum oryzae TaxID=286727 RepID=A0A6N1AFQ4_9PROT|nr:hypothetical protein [Azospirillum oryzae]KAA0588712.1 hypothetical protein FZ938_12660 [Azospirillum oryzae]QKS50059.1 hypothetical protein HUE56_05940 [Azospirillum oryzae]GLR81276.1 hypothetical protein GCM10007856_39600 [Azospirillum oryzae]
MIDLAALAGLFPAVLQATKEWTEPKVARIAMGTEMEEPAYLALKEKGHEFGWPRIEQVRDRSRKGWEPVTERDALGRPTIFTDPREELLLVHRLPPTS